MFLARHTGFLLHIASHQEITSAVSLVVKWSLVKAMTTRPLHCKDPLSPLRGLCMTSGTECISCPSPYSNVNRLIKDSGTSEKEPPTCERDKNKQKPVTQKRRLVWETKRNFPWTINILRNKRRYHTHRQNYYKKYLENRKELLEIYTENQTQSWKMR